MAGSLQKQAEACRGGRAAAADWPKLGSEQRGAARRPKGRGSARGHGRADGVCCAGVRACGRAGVVAHLRAKRGTGSGAGMVSGVPSSSTLL